MDADETGWGYPGLVGKAHWFGPDGRSLCGRWARFRTPVEPDDGRRTPDDCTACRRRLDARDARKGRR